MSDYNTLQDVFSVHLSKDISGITFINGINDDVFISYKDLYKKSELILGALQAIGIKYGNELIFQFSGTQEFIETFWACILGGIIPVPLNFGGKKEVKDKLINIYSLLDSPYVISTRNNLQILFSGEDKEIDHIKEKILIYEEMPLNKKGAMVKAKENDIAYIQFSSGSTGNPKGVILTHKNLLTNLYSIHAGINSPEEGDRFLSWMPLTHDMGLIGFHLTPALKGWDHFIIPTELFIRNPSIWLKKASQHKITFTSSPNFGYKYLLKHFRPDQNKDIDLSSLRIIVNGAEPISVSLCEEFVACFSKYGLKEDVIFPVYGLAEASLAASFSIPESEIISVQLNRDQLGLGEQVCIEEDLQKAASFVNVGKPVENTYIRIAGKNNEELEKNYVGKIQIKGNNVTSGYYKNEVATSSVIINGWLDTGDLGYKDDNGDFYITGRAKDIIFINGQNFYPHDLERITENQSYIELGKIAIGGIFDSSLHRDQIIVFILYRGKLEKFIEIAKECKTILNDKAGIVSDAIIPVKAIPKSTSGKVQRYKLLDDYKKGTYDQVIKEVNELLSTQGDIIELPQNETEREILEIWKDVLEKEDIGVLDNFFEIGGNSLSAGILIMRVKEELGVEILLKDLFERKNIREILTNVTFSADKQNYKLEVANDKEYYNLSGAQKRLFYHHHVNNDSIAYNLPQYFIIDGAIEPDKLKDAIQTLVDRHDILRSSFIIKNDVPLQRVHENVLVELEEIFIEDSKNIDNELRKYITPFDFEVAPLFRFKYSLLENDKALLLLDIHHIIADGSSVILLINELFKILNKKELNSCNIQYKEYLLWEENNIKTLDYKKKEEFWLNQFNDEIPVLEMPLDYTRRSAMSYDGNKIKKELNPELTQRITAFANANGISKQMFMFAAYSLLLNKYSGQEDIVIGVPEAGRNHIGFLKTLGMYVNNLAVRCFPKGEKKITDYLKEIKEQFFEVLINKEYAFDHLVEKLNIQKGTGRNPLFDTMFVYQNMNIPDLSIENKHVDHFQLNHKISRFDLTFEVMEKPNILEYYIEYSNNLFLDQTIESMFLHFEKAIECLISQPDDIISNIDLFLDEEKELYIVNYNDTQCEFNNNQTIHKIFEEKVLEVPLNPAIVLDNIEVTYRDLDRKANQLAWVLIDLGVRVNDFVVIQAERSLELIASILSVLKSGAAYVPVDILYPVSRKRFIIEDCKPKIILTTTKEYENNPEVFKDISKDRIIFIDQEDVYQESSEEINVKVSTNDLAYVIYTSGTTGKPKGVMIEHKSLIDYISWAGDNYVKGEKVNFPLFTSVAFDLTVTSIFTPLTTGNAIVIYPEIDNEIYIHKILRDDKVGVIKLTPSHLKLIRDDRELDFGKITNLRRFIVGGEDLETSLAKNISDKFNGNVEIYNEYGPTEVTVGCMIHKFSSGLDDNKSVPIGVPAANTEIFLLDKYKKPVIPGAFGEMYIAGKGVARGYLNRDKLTQERFVEIQEVCDGKLYKTGDVARFLLDGNMIFEGRVDNQININGFRVELGEIENKLVQYDGIETAVVLVREDKPKIKNICAYYTIIDDVDLNELKKFLSEELPFYMIPSCYTKMDVMPLTTNGKINTELLPAPESNNENDDYVAATDQMQETLVEVFQDVLSIEKVGIQDNFFELGGDSIKAVQITSRLYDKGVSLNVKDILTYQTISQISMHAEYSVKQYEQGLVSGAKGFTPIESWFFDLGLDNPNYFNQSVLLEFNKTIDKNRVEQIFHKLIKYHDGLRLNYNEAARSLFINNELLDKPITVNERFVDKEMKLEQLGAMLKEGFDIKSSLLIKATVIKELGKNDRLLITLHHLVIDGISWRVLLEDFYNLYKSEGTIELPKKTASILDWYNEMQIFANSDKIYNQRGYWKNIDEKVVELFGLDQIESVNPEATNKVSFKINKEDTEYLIKDANNSYHTDIQILLLTALLSTLKNLLDKDLFVLEIENHGRHIEEIDVSRTIGWFTAMYPVKFEVLTNDFEKLIKHVKEQVRNVPYEGLGYGALKYFLSEDNLKRNSCQLRFNYLGKFDAEINNDLFSYSNEYTGRDRSILNKTINGIEINSMVVDEELNIEIDYDSRIGKGLIEKMKEGFLCQIKEIMAFLKSEDDIHFTPSDFETASLDQEDLDVLFE